MREFRLDVDPRVHEWDDRAKGLKRAAKRWYARHDQRQMSSVQGLGSSEWDVCADANVERVERRAARAFLVAAGANQKSVSPTGCNQNRDLIMYLRLVMLSISHLNIVT